MIYINFTSSMLSFTDINVSQTINPKETWNMPFPSNVFHHYEYAASPLDLFKQSSVIYKQMKLLPSIYIYIQIGSIDFYQFLVVQFENLGSKVHGYFKAECIHPVIILESLGVNCFPDN